MAPLPRGEAVPGSTAGAEAARGMPEVSRPSRAAAEQAPASEQTPASEQALAPEQAPAPEQESAPEQDPAPPRADASELDDNPAFELRIGARCVNPCVFETEAPAGHIVDYEADGWPLGTGEGAQLYWFPVNRTAVLVS